MEPAGLALGVFGLYEVVKECIAVVSRAQNFSRQAAKLRVKYLIEEVRLQHWAQSWGYPDGTNLDTNLRTFSPALYQVAMITLREIYNTLQDTAKLKDRYGIESPLVGQTQNPPLLSRSWTAPTGGSPDNFSLTLISDVSSAPPDASSAPTGITLLRRAMWAISGATKLEALVKDLKEWNDSLACFQPRRQQEYADLALMAALMNQRGNDQIPIPQIMDALEDDGPAALGETASLKRYNEFLETNVLKPADNVQRRDLDLPEADFTFHVTRHDSESQELRVQSYHRRQNCMYQPSSQPNSEPITVIVEWKILPRDVKQEYKIISRSRIQNIALILHKSTKKPRGFCTLPCIGIISETDGTQGLVFELPQSTTTSTETDPPSVRPYCSLHELLPDKSKKSVSVYEPPLQHRFSLATNLCSAFLTFHSAAVVHKRFSSHDVVFSHPLERITTSEGSSGLQQPVITGFGFSRPVDDGFGSISVDTIPSVVISNDALATLEFSLYAHHSVIGRSPVSFSPKFDIYSLGLVLLEIGLWTRLEELLPSKNTLNRLGIEGPVCSTNVFIEAFHYTLISRYLPRLNVTMGGIYESVVRWCLEEQFEKERGLDQDSKVQEAFYWKAVNELAKCNI